jgi:hypothetical protein
MIQPTGFRKGDNSDINSPLTIRPTHISNAYIDFEEFKTKANAALNALFEKWSYDYVKELFFNWKANDRALKIPERGSYIFLCYIYFHRYYTLKVDKTLRCRQ